MRVGDWRSDVIRHRIVRDYTGILAIVRIILVIDISNITEFK